MTKSKTARLKDTALVAIQNSDSLTEAADRAGLSGQALYQILHNDSDLAMAYKETRARQTIAFLESLTARREHALDVITSLLDDTEQPGSVRLKAAQTILAATEKQMPVVDTIVNAEVSRARERRRGTLDWWDE